MRNIGALFAVALVVATIGVASAADTVTIRIESAPDSGVSGTAVLTDMGDHTQVVITVTGEPASGSEPAYIHLGQCSGQILAAKYTLKNVEGGTSTTVVPVKLEDIELGSYSIALHESPVNPLNLVACGTIPAVANAVLPKSGGFPLPAIVLSAGVLLGAGFALRRRPSSTNLAK